MLIMHTFMLPFVLQRKKGSNGVAECVQKDEICQIKSQMWSVDVQSGL